MPVDSSGSTKHEASPTLTQLLTQARRLRPTRKRTWLSGVSSGSSRHSRQRSSVASSWLANLLEYTYPVPNRVSIGIFQVHPDVIAIDEVYGSTPSRSSSLGTLVATARS